MSGFGRRSHKQAFACPLHGDLLLLVCWREVYSTHSNVSLYVTLRFASYYHLKKALPGKSTEPSWVCQLGTWDVPSVRDFPNISITCFYKWNLSGGKVARNRSLIASPKILGGRAHYLNTIVTACLWLEEEPNSPSHGLNVGVSYRCQQAGGMINYPINQYLLEGKGHFLHRKNV